MRRVHVHPTHVTTPATTWSASIRKTRPQATLRTQRNASGRPVAAPCSRRRRPTCGSRWHATSRPVRRHLQSRSSHDPFRRSSQHHAVSSRRLPTITTTTAATRLPSLQHRQRPADRHVERPQPSSSRRARRRPRRRPAPAPARHRRRQQQQRQLPHVVLADGASQRLSRHRHLSRPRRRHPRRVQDPAVLGSRASHAARRARAARRPSCDVAVRSRHRAWPRQPPRGR